MPKTRNARHAWCFLISVHRTTNEYHMIVIMDCFQIPDVRQYALRPFFTDASILIQLLRRRNISP